MTSIEGSGAVVAVGIDAAVVANHHIVVRQPEAGRPGTVVDDFVVPPTLVGMDRLGKRLASWPGAVAVVEPTSMTWLPLSIVLDDAGIGLSLIGNRHSARLRAALAGKNKSDPIDGACPGPATFSSWTRPGSRPRPNWPCDEPRNVGARRSPTPTGACAGSSPRPGGRSPICGTRSPGRGPPRSRCWAAGRISAHLPGRGSRRSPRSWPRTPGVAGVEHRAQQIRSTARAWAEFWDSHFDLDALGWETAELLDDLAAADARVDRATEATRRYWEQLWGDDPVLLSVPGMGPVLAPTVRAFLADGSHLDDAKQRSPSSG